MVLTPSAQGAYATRILIGQIRCRIWNLEFGISNFEFRIWNFEFRMSLLGFRTDQKDLCNIISVDMSTLKKHIPVTANVSLQSTCSRILQGYTEPPAVDTE